MANSVIDNATIEECCGMIKSQNRLLAKYIENDEHLFITTLDNLANRILELYHQNELASTYLRVIALEVMEHQKNYSEDVYHMFSKGVQAFLIAIEKELEKNKPN